MVAFLSGLWAFLQSSNGVALLAAMVVLDHALAALPGVSPSSTGGMILNGIDKAVQFIKNLVSPPAPPAVK